MCIIHGHTATDEGKHFPCACRRVCPWEAEDIYILIMTSTFSCYTHTHSNLCILHPEGFNGVNLCQVVCRFSNTALQRPPSSFEKSLVGFCKILFNKASWLRELSLLTATACRSTMKTGRAVMVQTLVVLCVCAETKRTLGSIEKSIGHVCVFIWDKLFYLCLIFAAGSVSACETSA